MAGLGRTLGRAVWTVIFLGVMPVLADPLGGAGQGGAGQGGKAPPRLVFSLSSGLSWSDNPDLSTPAVGGGAQVNSRLGLTFTNVTPLDSLSLDMGGQLRTGAGTDGLRDRSVALAYKRDTGNARLSLSLKSTITPAAQYDAALTPGETLATSGNITSQDASFDLETGVTAPLGFTLAGSYTGRTYSAPTASLSDSRSRSLSAGADWHVDAISTLSLTAAQSGTDYDNATATRQRSHSLTLGYERALRPDLSLSASLGSGTSTSSFLGVPVLRSSGASGSLGLTQKTATGTASVTLSSSRDALGSRQELSFGRDLKLPTGSFAATLGASARTGEAATLVGSLAWTQTRPTDSFGLNLSRQVALNSANVDQADTSLAMSWSHSVTAVARLGLNASLAQTGGAGGGAVLGSSRQSLSATWSRDLTADWQMTAGYQFVHRTQSGSAAATSNTVFLSVDRKFTLVP